MKNKKVSLLLLAILVGGFPLGCAAYGEIEEIHQFPSGPVHRPENTDSQWTLLQRLREQENQLFHYIKPAKKSGKRITASNDADGAVTPGTLVGIAVDRASLKNLKARKGTLAALVKPKEEDPNFTDPKAIFLPNGKLVLRREALDRGLTLIKKNEGKPNRQYDAFLDGIRAQMKKQRASYQKLFSRLTPKQKEQEQKSFAVLNAELGQLAKLEKAQVSDADEIKKVQERIKTFISQMTKATFNEAAKKSVIVEPVDEEDEGLPKSPTLVDPVHDGQLGIDADAAPEKPAPPIVKTYQEYLDFIAQEGKVEMTDAQQEVSNNLPKNIQSKVEAVLKKALKGYAGTFDGAIHDALEKDPSFLKLLTAIKNDTPENGKDPVELTVDYKQLIARAGKIAKSMQEILYATEKTGIVSSLATLEMVKQALQGRMRDLFDRNKRFIDRQGISDADLEELDTLEVKLRLCDQLESVYKEEQETKEAQKEKVKIEKALDDTEKLESDFPWFSSGQSPEELNKKLGTRHEEIGRLLEVAFGPDEKQWAQQPDFKLIETAYQTYVDLVDQDQSATKSAIDEDSLEVLKRSQDNLVAKLKNVFENRLNPSAVVADALVRAKPVVGTTPVGVQLEPSFGIKGNPLSPWPKKVTFQLDPEEESSNEDITAGGLHSSAEHKEGGEVPIDLVKSRLLVDDDDDDDDDDGLFDDSQLQERINSEKKQSTQSMEKIEVALKALGFTSGFEEALPDKYETLSAVIKERIKNSDYILIKTKINALEDTSDLELQLKRQGELLRELESLVRSLPGRTESVA